VVYFNIQPQRVKIAEAQRLRVSVPLRFYFLSGNA
jgi:hypothetical protein